MNSILEARNVSFAYGPAKWAIHDLSFALAEARARLLCWGQTASVNPR